MARPQIFDETEVIDTAMRLFWLQGYVATGMSQLLETTKLKPGSFYNAFASKKALFIRSLEYYNDKIVADRIARLLKAPDPISAIEGFLLSSFEPAPRSELIGCLLTNTATEVGNFDAEINQVVWSGLCQIKSAFKHRIIDAQESGRVAPELDPEVTALHLLSCFQGMGVIGRLTQDKAKLRSLTKTALQVLQLTEPSEDSA